MPRLSTRWVVPLAVGAVAAIAAVIAVPRLRNTVQPPVLGFHRCDPMLLRALPAGEVSISISEITRDDSGQVAGFVEEYAVASGAVVRTIVAAPPVADGDCSARTYTADTNGRQSRSAPQAGFSAEDHADVIGFGTRDIGGLLFIGPITGEFTTTFAYDDAGRQRLQSQSFTRDGGATYDVTYSGVTFDDRSRLTGYRAVLKARPSR